MTSDNVSHNCNVLFQDLKQPYISKILLFFTSLLVDYFVNTTHPYKAWSVMRKPLGGDYDWVYKGVHICNDPVCFASMTWESLCNEYIYLICDWFLKIYCFYHLSHLRHWPLNIQYEDIGISNVHISFGNSDPYLCIMHHPYISYFFNPWEMLPDSASMTCFHPWAASIPLLSTQSGPALWVCENWVNPK